MAGDGGGMDENDEDDGREDDADDCRESEDAGGFHEDEAGRKSVGAGRTVAPLNLNGP